VTPGHSVCFDNPGLRVVWPNSTSGEGEDCICDILEDLSKCNCVNSTFYDVEMINEQICWKNMTSKMNKTNIFFFRESLALDYNSHDDYTQMTPLVEREYILSYQIIIEGRSY